MKKIRHYRAYVKCDEQTIRYILREMNLRASFYTCSGCIVDFTNMLRYAMFVERVEELGGSCHENRRERNHASTHV